MIIHINNYHYPGTTCVRTNFYQFFFQIFRLLAKPPKIKVLKQLQKWNLEDYIIHIFFKNLGWFEIWVKWGLPIVHNENSCRFLYTNFFYDCTMFTHDDGENRETEIFLIWLYFWFSICVHCTYTQNSPDLSKCEAWILFLCLQANLVLSLHPRHHNF